MSCVASGTKRGRGCYNIISVVFVLGYETRQRHGERLGDKRGTMACDPDDYYCMNPSQADVGLVTYYSRNAAIPGALFKPKARVEGGQSTQPLRGPLALQAAFETDQHLPYAYPELQAMQGAAPLSGSAIQKWNVFLLPNGYFQDPIALRQPGKKERCGCGAKPKALWH